MIARICDLHASALILDQHLTPIITALVVGLEDSARIFANCAWGLQTLSDNLSGYSFDEDVIPQTSPMSMYYEGIMQSLMRVTEKYVSFVFFNQ